MRIGHIALTLPLLVVALAPVAACDLDPVHSSLVSKLGPEAASIPKNELHRAGQPCVVCHGDEGPASAKFSIAGTVFYGPGTATDMQGNLIPLIGASGVTVYIEDDLGRTYPTTTNCVGNFFVSPSEYQPQYPLLITVAGVPKGSLTMNTLQQSMHSQIGREPSCGMCHQVQSYLTQPGAIVNYYQTPGVIYLTGDDVNFKGDPMCPVQPPSPLGLAPVQL
jgi:hypothetical protein